MKVKLTVTPELIKRCNHHSYSGNTNIGLDVLLTLLASATGIWYKLQFTALTRWKIARLRADTWYPVIGELETLCEQFAEKGPIPLEAEVHLDDRLFSEPSISITVMTEHGVQPGTVTGDTIALDPAVTKEVIKTGPAVFHVYPTAGFNLPGKRCAICSQAISLNQELPIFAQFTQFDPVSLCTHCGENTAEEIRALCLKHERYAWAEAIIEVEDVDAWQAASMAQQSYIERVTQGIEPGHAGSYCHWIKDVPVSRITNIPEGTTVNELKAVLVMAGYFKPGDELHPIGNKNMPELSWRMIMEELNAVQEGRRGQAQTVTLRYTTVTSFVLPGSDVTVQSLLEVFPEILPRWMNIYGTHRELTDVQPVEYKPEK